MGNNEGLTRSTVEQEIQNVLNAVDDGKRLVNQMQGNVDDLGSTWVGSSYNAQEGAQQNFTGDSTDNANRMSEKQETDRSNILTGFDNLESENIAAANKVDGMDVGKI